MGTTTEEVRTLWIGDLQYWVEESYLSQCFAHTGDVVSIKIIRNKLTGQPEGYGFIEFVSHAAAERVLHSYNGTLMPGTEQAFRLNWASSGGDSGPDHSIFVGDLAPDVTDLILQETFRPHYPSVRGAKVVIDAATGRSKGYGFVKFSDEAQRNRAMTEMNGAYCSTRPMRISAATPKKTTSSQHHYAPPKAIYPYPAAYTTPVNTVLPENDINNTTVCVSNLDLNVTEEELRQTFLQFGDIVSVKIHAGKGYGFVQFGTRASAEEAIQRMQGKIIGQQVIHISWGSALTARQDLPGGWGPQTDPSQWGAYYAYGQGYEAYAYGTSHDPSLYAYGAYAGFAQYPQQVDGAQDMSAVSVPTEESYDPLAVPDVDKLNAAYISIHGNAILGRCLWQKTSPSLWQA